MQQNSNPLVYMAQLSPMSPCREFSVPRSRLVVRPSPQALTPWATQTCNGGNRTRDGGTPRPGGQRSGMRIRFMQQHGLRRRRRHQSRRRVESEEPPRSRLGPAFTAALGGAPRAAQVAAGLRAGARRGPCRESPCGSWGSWAAPAPAPPATPRPSARATRRALPAHWSQA